MHVTNGATRQGKRGRYGNYRQQGITTPFSSTNSQISPTITTATNLVPNVSSAVIGHSDANGLTINGTYGFSNKGPSNPDNRDIPIGRSGVNSEGSRPLDRLVRPDFPVRLNARGILTFPDTIKIPSIEGDVGVRGVVTARSFIISETNTPFTPSLKDMLGNTVTQTLSDGMLTKGAGGLAHLKINIIWSASTLDNASELIIDGLPSLKEGMYLMHAITGMAVNTVGAHFTATVNNDGDTTMILREVDNTTFSSGVAVIGSHTAAQGQFVINDIVRTH